MTDRPTHPRFLRSARCCAALLCLWLVPVTGRADRITFFDPLRGLTTVEGNVVAEADGGTILFEGRDGRQWQIDPNQVKHHEKSAAPVPLFDREELVESLQKEYGSDFKIYETKNYLIVHSTPEEFAEDAGRLFEKIKSVFENYIKRQGGFDPQQPKQPMIAVIFASQDEYIRSMQKVIGPIARMTAGVYVPSSNRMFMFDMFGGRDEAWFRRATMSSRRSADEIAMLLATDNISTVIHEGIHQVAFNTGFHDRNIRNPVWLVEGLATLMEVPELDSKSRWAGVGQINWDRADYLREHWDSVRPGFLSTLIKDDMALRSAESANLGYAEAWALSYYLSKAKKKEYMSLVEKINKRPILVEYTPDERLADFREAFGETPDEMESDVRRFIEKVVFKKSRPRR